jgi:hypothetical protein
MTLMTWQSGAVPPLWLQQGRSLTDNYERSRQRGERHIELVHFSNTPAATGFEWILSTGRLEVEKDVSPRSARHYNRSKV